MLGGIVKGIAGIAGGILGDKADAKAAGLNYQQQKEFAQNQIQWRVQDAQKAGIHPLYAAGFPSASYSGSVASSNMPAALANFGQDISRAIDSNRSAPERVQAREIGRRQLENMDLQNEMLRTQIANSKAALLSQAGGTPPSPSVRGVDQLGVNIVPSEVISSEPSRGHVQAGKPPSNQYYRTRWGGLIQMPSEQMKQAMEDDLISTALWNASERLPWEFLDPRKGLAGKAYRFFKGRR